MNVRSNTLEIRCREHQVAEVASALLHSILFYRTYGKFRYQREGYAIGTLGYEEVPCDFIDFTYVRCSSESLIDAVQSQVKEFVDSLRENEYLQGAIFLEFFLKHGSSRIGRMLPFQETTHTWEMWIIKIDCSNSVNLDNEAVESSLLEKLITIHQVVNSSKCFLPQTPSQQHLDTTFDTSLPDCQSYNYKIHYKIGNSVTPRLTTGLDFGPPSSAIKKFIKDTFYM